MFIKSEIFTRCKYIVDQQNIYDDSFRAKIYYRNIKEVINDYLINILKIQFQESNLSPGKFGDVYINIINFVNNLIY